MNEKKLDFAFSKLVEISEENLKGQSEDYLVVLANVWAFVKLLNDEIEVNVKSSEEFLFKEKVKVWSRAIKNLQNKWEVLEEAQKQNKALPGASKKAGQLKQLIEEELRRLSNNVRKSGLRKSDRGKLSLSKLSLKKSKWIKS
jgi:hypothetical protein